MTKGMNIYDLIGFIVFLMALVGVIFGATFQDEISLWIRGKTKINKKRGGK